jgi:hypothetical protein
MLPWTTKVLDVLRFQGFTDVSFTIVQCMPWKKQVTGVEWLAYINGWVDSFASYCNTQCWRNYSEDTRSTLVSVHWKSF